MKDSSTFQRLRAKTLTSEKRITELQYADDNIIVAHSEEDLQKAVDAFSMHTLHLD